MDKFMQDWSWKEYASLYWRHPLAVFFIAMAALNAIIAILVPIYTIAAYIAAFVCIAVTIWSITAEYYERVKHKE